MLIYGSKAKASRLPISFLLANAAAANIIKKIPYKNTASSAFLAPYYLSRLYHRYFPYIAANIQPKLWLPIFNMCVIFPTMERCFLEQSRHSITAPPLPMYGALQFPGYVQSKRIIFSKEIV